MESNILSTSGRISLGTYWTRWLIAAVVSLVSGFAAAKFESPQLDYVTRLFVIVIMTIQGVKRLHDVGKSGWYLLIPIYNVMLLLTVGNYGANEYDPRLAESSMTFSLNAFQELCDQLGFHIYQTERLIDDSRCDYSSVMAMGVYRDFAVTLDSWWPAHRFLTKVTLSPKLDVKLHLAPAGVLANVAEAMGLGGAHTRDAAFDHAFEIRTDNIDAVRAVLTPEVKRALYSLREANTSFLLTHEYIQAERHYLLGGPWSTEDGRRDLDPCADVARAMQRAVGPV